MSAHLYIQNNDQQNLDAFSKQVFTLLNVGKMETHYSVNHPGGHYVYAEALGLKIKLMEADSAEFPDYQFWIVFSPKVDIATTDGHSLDGLADIVARYLSQNGMKIARPLAPARAGTPSVLYGHDE